MAIQAVLFDLDNTLTHRDQSVQAYSRHLLNHFNRQLLDAEDDATLSRTVEIIRRIDNGGYPKKEFLTHPSIAASVAQALIQELNWDVTPSLETLTEFWFEEFGLSAVAMTGAVELLEHLKQRNYKLAVISNGGHATRLKILQGLGFHQYFDEVFSSESVGIAKPNAEIFLHSCFQIQIEPQHCLYIGDHPVNDYQGATSAGLNALLLDGFHPKLNANRPDDQPHIPKNRVIQHLHEVLKYLDV